MRAVVRIYEKYSDDDLIIYESSADDGKMSIELTAAYRSTQSMKVLIRFTRKIYWKVTRITACSRTSAEFLCRVIYQQFDRWFSMELP